MANQSVYDVIRTYGEVAKNAAIESLFENAERVMKEAKQRCPVRTGRLKESIHNEQIGESKVRVIADAKSDSGYCYGRIVEYSPRGRPFMRPALEAVRGSFKQHTLSKIYAAIHQH